MRSHPFDPITVIRALERHRVRYVVIGGFAGRLWGSPSLTNDLDTGRRVGESFQRYMLPMMVRRTLVVPHKRWRDSKKRLRQARPAD